MAGAAYDLLDRDAFLGQSKNASVGLFPSQVTLVLDPFGSGEELGIDRRGADRATHLQHGFLHSFKKGTAGVLHEMPAVGDLDGVGQSFGGGQRIAAATIARHNGDLGLAGEPSLSSYGLAVRQQCDWLATFKITDDRAVALVSPPSPVVDTHHGWLG